MSVLLLPRASDIQGNSNDVETLVPSSPKDITPSWVSAILARGSPRVRANSLTREPAPLRVRGLSIRGNSPGQNYCSDVFYVKAELEDMNQHLIVKIMPRDPERKAAASQDQLYTREIYFYRVINTDLQDIAAPTGLNLGLPHFYYADESSDAAVIVLEDLGPRGFLLQNFTEGLDNLHVDVVMKALAHFHAAAFVLKRQIAPESLPDRYPITITANSFSKDSVFVRFMKHNTELYAEMLETYGDSDLAQWVREFFIGDSFQESLKQSAAPDDEKLAITCHGDLWTNNILFRYKDDTPQEAVMLDFQFLRYANFIQDVIFFLVTSTLPAFWMNEYHKLLKKYYNYLISAFEELGYYDHCDISMSVVVDSFQRNLPFAFYTAVSSNVVILNRGINLHSSEDNPFMQNSALKQRTESIAQFIRDHQ